MNKVRLLSIFILVAMLSACGPVVNVTRLSQAQFRPKAPNALITAYLTKAPRCPYEELAIITTSSGSFAGGADTFVDAMKVEARKLGGDALLLGEIGTRTEGYVAVAPNIVAAARGNTMTAVVIRFTNPDCRD